MLPNGMGLGDVKRCDCDTLEKRTIVSTLSDVAMAR
jgi:hypothetical protein